MALKQNIDNLISAFKKKHIDVRDRTKLMAVIFSMIVSYCNIDQNKYHILSSYAIHEFKPVADLDVNMSNAEWPKIKKCGLGTEDLYNGQKRYFITFPSLDKDAEIEIFSKAPTVGFPNDKFSHKALQKKLIRDEYGHLYYNLETFIKWKTTVHRSKDKQHLQLVKRNLKKYSKSGPGILKLRTMGIKIDSKNSKQCTKLIEKIDKILDTW